MVATTEPTGFRLYPGFLDAGCADWLFHSLLHGVDWRQQDIRLFGRLVPQPRLTAWFAEPGINYAYSGLAMRPAPFPDELDALRAMLAAHSPVEFNSVLLNLYRNGADSMGWHADDEPELGDAPEIASVSLGATRTIRIRPRRGGPSHGLALEHGSLLLMSGRSQQDYQHAVPKTRRPVGQRINLTFRRVFRPAEAHPRLT